MPTHPSGAEKRWLVAAGLMILALPAVRLIEAMLRSVFMSEHYGSFWDGLTRDRWFSEGWVSYVQTPLGLTMTLLPMCLMAGAAGCVFSALRRGLRQSKRTK